MRIQAPANEAGVVHAIRATRAYAGGCALSGEVTDRLCLVVDEWLTNVVEHGAADPASRLMVAIARTPEGFTLTISDAGQAFDPRHTPAFESPNPERGGGAGLELVRAWADITDYRYSRGRNRVVLWVRTA